MNSTGDSSEFKPTSPEPQTDTAVFQLSRPSLAAVQASLGSGGLTVLQSRLYADPEPDSVEEYVQIPFLHLGSPKVILKVPCPCYELMKVLNQAPSR